jgi:hypothetical protein
MLDTAMYLIQTHSQLVLLVAYILRRCYRYVTEVMYKGLVARHWQLEALMIRVCIEVDSGTSSPTMLSVTAESIMRALEVAGERNPGRALHVVFPLDPDNFFVQDASEGVEAEIAA